MHNVHNTLYAHLESYTPGQDQAKQYVPVCTGLYQYILVRTVTFIQCWYVLVRTGTYLEEEGCDYLIHPGSDLRVKFNSVHVLCKRYDRMKSNFKKCKVQVMHVHISTYRHEPHTRFISMMLCWLEHLSYRSQPYWLQEPRRGKGLGKGRRV